MFEHLTHFFTGGEGERAAVLFFIEHGRQCWCLACNAARVVVKAFRRD